MIPVGSRGIMCRLRAPSRVATMPLAVSIALASLYVGLSLWLGGTRPEPGMPWWFLVPLIVVFCATLAATRIFRVLPVPWSDEPHPGSRPRRVRLSWRTALWLPAWVPALLVPWHFLAILRMHFDLAWVSYLVLALAAAGLALGARRRGHEFRLLRDGEMAAALVHHREDLEETTDLITYSFGTPGGRTVSGRARDAGYGVRVGSRVPVFYDPNDPVDHVVACACWFEVR
jgi:hypothetical protein